MKRNKFFLGLLGAFGIILTGCSSNVATTTTTTTVAPTSTTTTTTTTTTTPDPIHYSVKVIDLDGEVLFDRALTTYDSGSLISDLKRETTVVEGAWIHSISGSIIDNNYYLALYENGDYSQVGANQIVLDDGDEIVFQSECYNTALDDTDKLVDKAIYQYIKNYLIEDVKDDTVGSLKEDDGYGGYSYFTNFWTYLAVGFLKDNGFEIDIKTENAALYNAIKDYDLTTLTTTSYGKYYYYAKAFDVDMTAFKTKYKAFINDTLESEYTAGYSQEYSIPFEIAPAKGLKIVDTKITGLVSTDYVPPLTTEWGGVTFSNYDGYNWFQTVNLLFGKEKDTTTLNTISQLDYTKETPTTIALSIATFAASNEDVRKTEYKNNGKDLVELLLESYDPDLGLIKVYGTDTGLNYSNNQIYASLFAYKFQRDTRVISSLEPKAFNIFS